MARKPPANVVPFPGVMPAAQPDQLAGSDALRVVRALAADTKNIFIIKHAKLRQRQRLITRPQIERCVQKGVVTEGPYLNAHGHWQMNLTRYAAGEEITCVVAIEWVRRVIVITTF